MDAHRQLTPTARRAWTVAVLFSGLVLTIAHVMPIVTLDELGPGARCLLGVARHDNLCKAIQLPRLLDRLVLHVNDDLLPC